MNGFISLSDWRPATFFAPKIIQNQVRPNPHFRSHKAARLDVQCASSLLGADAPSNWHPLHRPMLWHGTEAEALENDSMPSNLTPPWKVMLLSDGSVTRHLQLMTGLPVHVECLEMRRLQGDTAGLPPAVSLIEGLLLQRQVLLRLPAPQDKALVYAASWWNADIVERYLKDKEQPIWVSLSRERTELYREILHLECGESAYLEEKFGAKGPFWGRSYLFWHEGKPLTLIYEAFSSGLDEFLGPYTRQGGV